MAAAPVDISIGDGIVIARVGGDIDISNRTTVASRILAAMENDAIGLVIDLGPVRYLDSAGISMLFEIARQLDTCRQRAGIALGDDSPLRKLLKITNIHEVVTLCSSVEECAAALRESPA